MRRTVALLPVALVALGLAGAAPALAAGPIGTVDIVRLVTNHPKFKELESRVEQRGKDAQAHEKKETERLDELKGRIGMMNPNDPARRTQEKQYLQAVASLKFELEWMQQDAQREYLRGLEVIYAEVQAAVGALAREQGLQLVLVRNDKELKAVSFDDWGLKTQLRAVVWAESSLDLTDALLKRAPFVAPPR
jgi:Skp family chaperone for outer membrane proteins